MSASAKKSESKSLSREVKSLSNKMQQDPLFPIISLGRVLMSLADQKTVEASELSVTKALVLTSLVLNGGCLTSTILSKKVFTTKSTISRTIVQLEEEGLVMMEKNPIPKDKRLKRIFVTQKGIDLVRKQLPLGRHLYEEVSSFLTPEEFSVLRILSQKLLNHLPWSEVNKDNRFQKELT